MIQTRNTTFQSGVGSGYHQGTARIFFTELSIMAFTFFFRDLAPLEAAVRLFCPLVSGRSRIRVWDAGCATGQEPYTLAILLAENMGQFAFRNLKIHATDHDAPLLKTVREAVYPDKELDRIPPDYFSKYFGSSGTQGMSRVIEHIRNSLIVEEHDLLSLTPPGEGFSMIVCKNVLLHFRHEERIKVIRMFHRALEPSGLLVMEHTQKMPDEISEMFRQAVNSGQVYQKI